MITLPTTLRSSQLRRQATPGLTTYSTQPCKRPRPVFGHPDSRKWHATKFRIVRMEAYYLGLDFGTSGARATVINDAKEVVSSCKAGYGGSQGQEDLATVWQRVLFELLGSIPNDVITQVRSVAIDGTSATAMLLDAKTGRLLAPVKLYNESQDAQAVHAAKAIAPAAHTATASTSTLCKLLTWHQQGVWQKSKASGAMPRLLHQADWLASLLHGQRHVTDWNNALKLGFDPGVEKYPDWLLQQEYAELLPATVVAPGAAVASVLPAVCAQTRLPEGCVVCGGTTDSIAAFVAAGVTDVGQAVTSLGSTLAVKLLSSRRVDDAAYGIYSHRLGEGWLVGGASNSGGAVLRSFFTDEELRQLTELIDPTQTTGLDYYPLPAPGERFPVNDPNLQPRLEPRPDDNAKFLQGIFEGIARIEAQAYQQLAVLGATPVTEVVTAGGGAVNSKWTTIRANTLGVPVRPAANGEASYGSALLAQAVMKG